MGEDMLNSLEKLIDEIKRIEKKLENHIQDSEAHKV